MRITDIRVGIKTLGAPQLVKHDGCTRLKNMLIGDGFHWQQALQVDLPGSVEPVEFTEETYSRDGVKAVSLINVVPLNTYLECVVGSEMNPKAPIEFLKAHAVISRSWAMGKILKSHHSDSREKVNSENIIIGWDDTDDHAGFDVCSDDHCQRYQGLQPISPEARRAIRETERQVITANGKEIVDARFSKCCGGTTELFETCWQNQKVPGIESFEDPWCDLQSLSPSERRNLLYSILKDYDLATEDYGFRWKTEISKLDIAKNLKEKFGRDMGEVVALTPLHRGPSGRIDLLRVETSEGTLDIGKELWIRRLLSPSHLYSSSFNIEDRGDTLVLNGKGWGHGVGLCQIGAANMALHGYNYKEILTFYYPGTTLTSV